MSGTAKITESGLPPVKEGYGGADYYALMTEALHKILLERQLLKPEDTDRVIAALEAPSAEWGALIVARAWCDPDYEKRLLEDGSLAAAELGYTIKEAKLVVVKNTPILHNLIVCTLCSCYPRSLLGQPPWWYISKAYRARAVREPRAVLAEFGVDLAPDVEVRVHDSNADMRYLVLPMRPAGTGGLDEEALARLVTRDSMIGAGLAGAS
ncbi:MAG: nitrile hydratase subunit alpha [Rhodomicrobium sp.]